MGDPTLSSQLLSPATPARQRPRGSGAWERVRDNSRSPPGGIGTGVAFAVAPPPGLDHAPVDLPKQVDKHIRNQVNEYKQRIEELIRQQRRVERCTSEVESFATGELSYPVNCKEYRHSAAFTAMTEQFPSAASGPISITIQVPARSSFGEAAKHIHHGAMKAIRGIELEAQQVSLAQAKLAADPSVLGEIATAAYEIANPSSPLADLDLGLVRPQTQSFPLAAIQASVQKHYARVFADLDKKLRSESDRAKKQQEESASQLEDVDPQVLFDQAVEHRVNQRLAELGLTTPPDDQTMDPDAPPTSPTTAFVSSMLPGNDTSPPGGQNTRQAAQTGHSKGGGKGRRRGTQASRNSNSSGGGVGRSGLPRGHPRQ